MAASEEESSYEVFASNGAGILTLVAVIFLLMPSLISPAMGLESTVTNSGNTVEADRSSVLADLLTAEEENDRKLTNPDQFSRTYFQGESVSSGGNTYASVYVSDSDTLTTLSGKSPIVVPIPASIDSFVIHVKMGSDSFVLNFWNEFMQKTDAGIVDQNGTQIDPLLTISASDTTDTYICIDPDTGAFVLEDSLDDCKKWIEADDLKTKTVSDTQSYKCFTIKSDGDPKNISVQVIAVF
ncbi:MAG: hypothetical protein LKJ94_03165 [Candidatus Methanomethylophilus sp.]|nr:hypothetical protein [Methanomethylophilus sp.]MCI2093422.1 hypothetical protein [Methanomethylophilus sp.]